jgi:hypothetical protein
LFSLSKQLLAETCSAQGAFRFISATAQAMAALIQVNCLADFICLLAKRLPSLDFRREAGELLAVPDATGYNDCVAGAAIVAGPAHGMRIWMGFKLDPGRRNPAAGTSQPEAGSCDSTVS